MFLGNFVKRLGQVMDVSAIQMIIIIIIIIKRKHRHARRARVIFW